MVRAVCEPLLLYNGEQPRALVIDRGAPGCACEACNFSLGGPIAPDEVLIRLILSPVHINRKGHVKSAALSHAESMGMSTFRDAIISDEELVRQATKLVTAARTRDPRAGMFGVLRFRASVPKSPRADEGGAVVYCLYDVPDDGIDAHADIYQRVEAANDELRAERRQWLFQQVEGTFIPTTAFRGGLLADLLPSEPNAGS